MINARDTQKLDEVIENLEVKENHNGSYYRVHFQTLPSDLKLTSVFEYFGAVNLPFWPGGH